MKTSNKLMFVVLSVTVLTALTATTGSSIIAAAYADKKHCEDNGDNNCNSTHKTQKIKAKNECEIENTNKHHSKNNDNVNVLDCSNQAANLKDTALVNNASIFGDVGP
ncbi:MAG TPA: hypothetical protein VF884_05075 [Nitrososphaeraceae archaeon]